MADVSITSADVLGVTDVSQSIKTAGGAITAGMLVYEKRDADGVRRVYAAQATGTDEAKLVGVAMDTTGAADQPIVIATRGIIDIGGTLLPGTAYVVSAANAGGVAPDSDLATGNFISLLGVALTSNNIILCVLPTNEQVP